MMKLNEGAWIGTWSIKPCSPNCGICEGRVYKQLTLLS